MDILIVEDEINARDGLAYLLGKISDEYVVCGKASDGEQGVELALELKPDLVFVDIEMPKLNGLEMIEKIIAKGERPSFVILSGYSEFKYAQKGIKLGVSDYLLKPITYNDLKNIMEIRYNEYKAKKEKEEAGGSIAKDELLGNIMLEDNDNYSCAYKILEKSIVPEAI